MGNRGHSEKRHESERPLLGRRRRGVGAADRHLRGLKPDLEPDLKLGLASTPCVRVPPRHQALRACMVQSARLPARLPACPAGTGLTADKAFSPMAWRPAAGMPAELPRSAAAHAEASKASRRPVAPRPERRHRAASLPGNSNASPPHRSPSRATARPVERRGVVDARGRSSAAIAGVPVPTRIARRRRRLGQHRSTDPSGRPRGVPGAAEIGVAGHVRGWQ